MPTAEFTIEQVRERLGGPRSSGTDEAPRPTRPAGSPGSFSRPAGSWGLHDRRILVALAVVGVAVLAFTVLRGTGTAEDGPETAVSVSRAAAGPVDTGTAPGEEGEADAGAETSPPPAPLRIHVAGAVARPGVFTLPEGSIAEEALGAAGGPVDGADLDRINLAAKLADGQQLYVPKAGEAVPAATASSPASPAGARPTGPIDLNTADLAALDALPGVGAATAQKIVTYREEHGKFRSPRDLLDVPGIGEAKLAQIEPLVTT